MKRTLMALLAATTFAAAAPAIASAQPNRNASEIERQIRDGERAGRLNNNQSRQYRSQLQDIERQRERYRSGGYNDYERRDIDNRLEVLAALILGALGNQGGYGNGYGNGYGYNGGYGHNNGYGGQYQQRYPRWEEHFRNLENNIREGVRGGGLTQREANNLRNEVRSLQQHFNQASRGGINDRELRDLNRHLDNVAERIRRERLDNEHNRGRNRYRY